MPQVIGNKEKRKEAVAQLELSRELAKQMLQAGASKRLENCARSVHESKVFSALGLAFERKQIPRFVVNAGS